MLPAKKRAKRCPKAAAEMNEATISQKEVDSGVMRTDSDHSYTFIIDACATMSFERPNK